MCRNSGTGRKATLNWEPRLPDGGQAAGRSEPVNAYLKGLKLMKKTMGFLLLLLLVSVPVAEAVETAPRISDREIIDALHQLDKRVALLEAGQAKIESSIAALRVEFRGEINTLRRDLMNLLIWGFGVLFSGMFILIGFILWDRRSTIKPIRDELKALEVKKVDRMLQALQKLAQDDPKLAEVLRSFSLL